MVPGQRQKMSNRFCIVTVLFRFNNNSYDCAIESLYSVPGIITARPLDHCCDVIAVFRANRKVEFKAIIRRVASLLQDNILNISLTQVEPGLVTNPVKRKVDEEIGTLLFT